MTEIKPIPKAIDKSLYVAEYHTEDQEDNDEAIELQRQQLKVKAAAKPDTGK